MAIYADDVILTGIGITEMTQFNTCLDDTFKIKYLGKLHYFLGLEILDTTRRVLISQKKFFLDILKEYDCFNYRSLSSPLDSTVKLRAEKGEPLPDPTYYKKLLGNLNFLINTRLDITLKVQHLI